MPVTLPVVRTPGAQPGAQPGTASVPAATRARRPGWRDPRLVVGLLIVAGSVLLGAATLTRADDTVPVWVAAGELTEGQPLGSADLEVRRVRFGDPSDADRYLSATQPLPDGLLVTRVVGQGELLPRSALGTREGGDLVEVPISVSADQVPATVRVGSVVDVWVAPDAGSDGSVEAVAVLSGVVVVAAPAVETTLGPSGNRQIIVGVDVDDADQLGSALAGTATGHVVITRQR